MMSSDDDTPPEGPDLADLGALLEGPEVDYAAKMAEAGLTQPPTEATVPDLPPELHLFTAELGDADTGGWGQAAVNELTDAGEGASPQTEDEAAWSVEFDASLIEDTATDAPLLADDGHMILLDTLQDIDADGLLD